MSKGAGSGVEGSVWEVDVLADIILLLMDLMLS